MRFKSACKRSRRQPPEETSGQAAAVVENHAGDDTVLAKLVAILNHSTL